MESKNLDDSLLTATVMIGPKRSLRHRWVACAAVITIALLGVLTWRESHRRRPFNPVLMWIRQSRPDRSGNVARENWKGPREAFEKIDVDGDGVLTPEEIASWTEQEKLPRRESSGSSDGEVEK